MKKIVNIGKDENQKEKNKISIKAKLSKWPKEWQYGRVTLEDVSNLTFHQIKRKVSIFTFYIEVISLMKKGRRLISLEDCKKIFEKFEKKQ